MKKIFYATNAKGTFSMVLLCRLLRLHASSPGLLDPSGGLVVNAAAAGLATVLCQVPPAAYSSFRREYAIKKKERTAQHLWHALSGGPWARRPAGPTGTWACPWAWPRSCRTCSSPWTGTSWSWTTPSVGQKKTFPPAPAKILHCRVQARGREVGDLPQAGRGAVAAGAHPVGTSLVWRLWEVL